MQYDEEKLEYKLKSLEVRENALLEEHKKILTQLDEAKGDKSSVATLREQLRANVLSLKEIRNELRQAYKDFRNVN